MALIEALREVITVEGNIVMPAHSGDYSDPKYWENPPVPEEWWSTIRQEMPPFQPGITPTRGVGVVPETFRQYPDVHRSDHPASSFAAWGQKAEEIISNHDLDYALGENSPLAKIYELEGLILLIGVDHDRNNSLHLAEYRADYAKEEKVFGAPVIKNGQRVWAEYKDIDYGSEDFIQLGKAYEKEGDYDVFELGHTKAKLFSQRKLVDFAVGWFECNR